MESDSLVPDSLQIVPKGVASEAYGAKSHCREQYRQAHDCQIEAP